jgi:hypothetical protein
MVAFHDRFRRWGIVWGLAIWTTGMLALPLSSRADTPLTQAVLQSMRNTVRLLLQNQPPRPAKVQDRMVPGDSLATERASLAELRFNDGSLARIGEKALFQFVPSSRQFRLNTGTVLLLVPPGRGTTRIRTPNAAAGVRGSALFVRYIPGTDTTVIGALTESGIEVFNRDRSERQPLKAGTMAAIVKNRIVGIYTFDLKHFFETSDLLKGIDLSQKAESDPDLAAVQQEMTAAIAAQPPLSESQIVLNPAFIRNGAASSLAQAGNELSPPAALWMALPPASDVAKTVGLTGSVPEVTGAQVGRNGGGVTPGASGFPPGLFLSNPGRGQSGPPGLLGTAPGLSGSNPGLSGTAPGLSGLNPGQSSGVAGPPGQTGAAPGLGGSGPPGQTGLNPGQSRKDR